MVKHLVMWKLEDGLDRAQQAMAFREQANTLLSKIEGVLKVELWEGYKAQTIDHDLALYIEFAGREAEAGYRDHPCHIQFKEFIKGKVRERVCIDTEV